MCGIMVCCAVIGCIACGGMLPCLCLEGQCAAAGPGVVACSWLVASFAGLSCAAPPFGGGTDVWGGLPPSQGLASVPLCLTSPSAVQISFPVQLSGPPQVAAPPAWSATGLVLSPDCLPIPAKLVKRSLLQVRGDAGFSDGQCHNWLIDWSPLVFSQAQWFAPGCVRCHLPWPGFTVSWPMQQFVVGPIHQGYVGLCKANSGGGHVSRVIWMA